MKTITVINYLAENTTWRSNTEWCKTFGIEYISEEAARKAIENHKRQFSGLQYRLRKVEKIITTIDL